MTIQSYSGKTDRYFGNPRVEIQPMLPTIPARVLEIGCGAGATLKWLKDIDLASHTVGVELFAEAAERAMQCCDEVHQGDAEELVQGSLAHRQFDVVLCLDVLEHMVDPWTFVDRVQALLKPGGTFICSLPNVRNLNVVLPLVFKGEWRYQHDGILDQTHLRFFTLQSAQALASRSGLTVQTVLRTIPPAGSKGGLLNRLTLGLMKDLLTVQYVVKSLKKV